MAFVDARLKNRYIFKYQIVFSEKIDKQDEDGQMLDEIDWYRNLKINQSLTESDIGIIDIKCSLEHQIQSQEIKESGWSIGPIDSKTIYFYKTAELDGLSKTKFPLSSSDVLNIENDVCSFVNSSSFSSL